MWLEALPHNLFHLVGGTWLKPLINCSIFATTSVPFWFSFLILKGFFLLAFILQLAGYAPHL